MRRRVPLAGFMKNALFVAFAMGMTLTAAAQYQVANSDFEVWETVTYGGKRGEEPVRWSSFLDGTGGYKNMAGAVQLEKSSNELRPGTSGRYSAKIYARNVFFVVAQGNLTTGCVNMSSMSPSDGSGNYNYINEARKDQAMRFSGRPDAVRVWLKFKGANRAKVSVFLTSKGYYQDPYANTGKITATLVSKAIKDDIKSNDKWTEYTIPFGNEGTDEKPYYALVYMATSSKPGKGNRNDYMFIDDMEMLYYSEATAITYNGRKVAMGSTVDEVYDPALFSGVDMTGRAATYTAEYDKGTAVLTITVKGENISEAPENRHTYTVKFRKPAKELVA